MKVSGTEIQNQRASMATRVPNGMAAEEPSPHRIRFITKKSANTTLSGHGEDGQHGGSRTRVLHEVIAAVPGAEEGRQQNVGLPLLSSESCPFKHKRKGFTEIK